MRKKITVIMCCAAIALCAGISVAYYNTKSFGFDDSATVISYDSEKISFMDFDIYYEDISDFIDSVGRIIPDKSRIAALSTQHNVVCK